MGGCGTIVRGGCRLRRTANKGLKGDYSGGRKVTRSAEKEREKKSFYSKKKEKESDEI